MNYYKLIQDHTIIGAVSTDDMRKQSANKKMILFANEETAQFIDYNNQYYYDEWLRPLPDGSSLSVISVKIEKISKEDYDNLRNQLDEGNYPMDNSLEESLETIEEDDIDEPIIVQKTAAQLLEEQIKLAARFAEV